MPRPVRPDPSRERRDLIARAFRLEWLSVGWMAGEAAVAVTAGVAAHSLTLLAFGADSVIELASAGVLLWRLTVEIVRGDEFPEAVERRAARIGAVLLFGLALYVATAAGWSLWTGSGQQFSLVGLIVAVVAIPVMLLLARCKAGIAQRIASPALRADAAEAIACAYLSAVIVLGLVAQWLLAAWWIDGVTGLVLVPFLVREGAEAWPGDES
jgi:divalent metal cation (Fe/Co/Zn/Cd) transporter